MMPFLLGVGSGKLFDAGYFHAVEISGSIIFVVWSVENYAHGYPQRLKC